MMKERYGMRVTFGPGTIVYKETIRKPVEGVGHFEPLRHYAECICCWSPESRAADSTSAVPAGRTCRTATGSG